MYEIDQSQFLLIVGHTHKVFDQRFSVISNVLKRKDINMLEEMLKLVKRKISYKKVFVIAWKLEHERDWKTFITPHLLQGRDQLIDNTFPHHMRFYIENGVIYIKQKHFCMDEWNPLEGHLCLK